MVTKKGSVAFIKKSLLFISILFLGLSLGSVSASENRYPSRNETLVIARISDNPKRHLKTLQPLVDYVAAKMKDLGIVKGEVILAKDNQQMISLLNQGVVDWISETPFSATLFEEKGGAEILLLRWKNGVPNYSTVFITKAESNIYSLNDLLGKKIAFEDRGSTTGFYLPMSILKQQGIPVKELSSPRESVPENTVGYIFSSKEINSASWVYKGITDVAAISNLDWTADNNVPLTMRDELKIFHESQLIPRSLELIQGNLDPQLKARLKEILLNIHEDPAAKEVLRIYKNTVKFQELNEEIQSSIQSIRDLRTFIAED